MAPTNLIIEKTSFLISLIHWCKSHHLNHFQTTQIDDNDFFFGCPFAVLPGKRHLNGLDVGWHTCIGPWEAYHVVPCVRELVVHPYDCIMSIHICHKPSKGAWLGCLDKNQAITWVRRMFIACQGYMAYITTKPLLRIAGPLAKKKCQEIPMLRTRVSIIKGWLKWVKRFILGCARCLSSSMFSGRSRLEHYCQQKRMQGSNCLFTGG